MLSLATFQIDRATYDDGFFIVFLVTADDSLCGNKDPPELNRKGIFEETKKYSIFYSILQSQPPDIMIFAYDSKPLNKPLGIGKKSDKMTKKQIHSVRLFLSPGAGVSSYSGIPAL